MKEDIEVREVREDIEVREVREDIEDIEDIGNREVEIKKDLVE